MKKFLLLLFVFLTLAQAKYFNTNPLIERSIDPQVLNLAVTIYKQDVAYEIDAKHTKKWNKNTEVENFKLLYDPFKPYGIDIRIKVPKKDSNRYSKSDIKKELDQMMGLQSYLQSEKLYKPESIEYLGKENGFDVIAFDFDNDKIPRELDYFENLHAKVYIKDKTLYKIIVTNFKSFEYLDVKIEKFEKTLYFSQPIQNSGYLLTSISASIKGTKEELPYRTDFKGNFVNYKDKNGLAIYLKDMPSSPLYDEKEFEVINVNLDRTLPFYGQEVRKMGYDLPKPFGISLVTMYQETRFYMDGVSVDTVNGTPSLGDVSRFFRENSKYENSTYATLLRADMWVLPFLNFSLLAGGTSTSTDINLDLCIVPGLGCPSGGLEVPGHVNTNSILYGAGATIGGGMGNFFASVDFQYMISYTDTADVETQINIITPIFGYYFQDLGLRAYGGAMYEDLKEDMGYTVTSASGDEIVGTINLKAEKWAGTLGAQYAFTRHWEGNILAAYGEDFQNLSLVITYRW